MRELVQGLIEQGLRQPEASTEDIDPDEYPLPVAIAKTSGPVPVITSKDLHELDVALDGRAAWRVLEQWMNMPHVSLVHEPPGIDELIGHWVTSVDTRGGDWTDAYLAAFAAADGYRLVTFDSGFERFPGLAWLHLKP